jgi:hypothetical protein
MEVNKTQYMRMGLGMCGIAVSDITAEIIIRVYEELQKMGGDFSLRDASRIESEVTQKYEESNNFLSIKAIEDFYDDTINQIHTRSEEDPVTPDMIVKALKNLIETHKEDPT